MKLSLRTTSKSKRVLLFGPPKSGKSLLAGKCAEAFNLLWVDCENGHDTLFQLPVEQQNRIELIALPDTRSYPIAIETCLKIIKGQKGSVCETHGKWSCPVCVSKGEPVIQIELSALPLDTIVVFDSLTQLTNSAIAHITKGQPDDYRLQYEDYANLGKLLDIFLSHVQQAGFHVICISHETESEMEDGKQKLVPTAGTRAFSRNTAKYFDEVIYCEIKNKKHVAASSTLYNGNILTGSRSGAVLEADQSASLIPIFKGEVKPQNIASANSSGTPGATASSQLDALRLKMKGLTK